MFVGIDVSKARLDVALRPGDENFSVANNPRGIASLVKQLKQLQVSLIVLEASGGYEVAVASELATAALPVAVLNPRQVRNFARATGRLAKTDAIVEAKNIYEIEPTLAECLARSPWPEQTPAQALRPPSRCPVLVIPSAPECSSPVSRS